MSFVERSNKLWQELEAIVVDEGLTLYDVERLGDGSLRIFIAKAGAGSVAPETEVGLVTQASETQASGSDLLEEDESEVLDVDSSEDELSVEAQEGIGQRQGGVTTGDCARICRRLMTYFSVEGPQFGLSTEPQMEVSSPGINRSLRLPEHYQTAVGERVKIVWQRQVDGKNRSETTVGLLKIFTEKSLSLVDEKSGDTLDVLLNDVRKAHIDFPF